VTDEALRMACLMDRATFKLVTAAGVLLNSALYLGGVLAAALLWRNRAAAELAIATLGITYLSYVCHLVGDHRERVNAWLGRRAPELTWLSILFGVAAGVLLLFG
jgi:hypothetical protein